LTINFLNFTNFKRLLDAFEMLIVSSLINQPEL
jgi:hypothetical protein